MGLWQTWGRYRRFSHSSALPYAAFFLIMLGLTMLLEPNRHYASMMLGVITLYLVILGFDMFREIAIKNKLAGKKMMFIQDVPLYYESTQALVVGLWLIILALVAFLDQSTQYLHKILAVFLLVPGFYMFKYFHWRRNIKNEDRSYIPPKFNKNEDIHYIPTYPHILQATETLTAGFFMLMLAEYAMSQYK